MQPRQRAADYAGLVPSTGSRRGGGWPRPACLPAAAGIATRPYCCRSYGLGVADRGEAVASLALRPQRWISIGASMLATFGIRQTRAIPVAWPGCSAAFRANDRRPARPSRGDPDPLFSWCSQLNLGTSLVFCGSVLLVEWFLARQSLQLVVAAALCRWRRPLPGGTLRLALLAGNSLMVGWPYAPLPGAGPVWPLASPRRACFGPATPYSLGHASRTPASAWCSFLGSSKDPLGGGYDLLPEKGRPIGSRGSLERA